MQVLKFFRSADVFWMVSWRILELGGVLSASIFLYYYMYQLSVLSLALAILACLKGNHYANTAKVSGKPLEVSVGVVILCLVVMLSVVIGYILVDTARHSTSPVPKRHPRTVITQQI